MNKGGDDPKTKCVKCGKLCPDKVCCTTASSEDEDGTNYGYVTHENAWCLACCFCSGAIAYQQKQLRSREVIAAVVTLETATPEELRVAIKPVLKRILSNVAVALYSSGLNWTAIRQLIHRAEGEESLKEGY